MDRKIHNIIFDVGMVLIDFCWEQHCRNLGLDEEVIRSFDQNMISSDYWSMLDEGMIEEADAIQKFIEKMPQYEKQIRLFWKHPEEFVEEYAYATPMIRALRDRGYRIYLLSNYPLDMYKLHWPTFSFYTEVDGYVVSAVERMKKPDLAIYNLLCERYRLNPTECLFVDDRQVNVEAARQVGMQGIVFESYEKLRQYFEI